MTALACWDYAEQSARIVFDLALALPIVEDDASFTAERWQSDDESS